ncbi:DUF4253 domain-containing protein [Micromonospora andamanensis]|uniref:DUF4253 domain-containing protein n=1 Tax=Micromonospora andamanensis TaxID=1287068 RepID=UPI001950488E|nr:DUF4253 domain-containing protein [Micromonospora andamanensis]GIJ42972.1 hypothetical protein Vwe01_62970 [Micromonospora andamanensis]
MTELPRLVAALPPDLLPPGRLVAPFEQLDTPAYWLSDGPAAAETWSMLYARRSETGLYPLLLTGTGRDATRPWADGEVWPAHNSAPGAHDPAALLAEWWARHAPDDDSDTMTAPYGRVWPGRAGSPTDHPHGTVGDPDAEATSLARQLVDDTKRLGLVAASRGADTLATTGWAGPANHTGDSGEIAAVVRSWEDRFDVRVVEVGFDTLYLSVAAPPTTHEHALHVAAEHFAFCPDIILQGVGSLQAYAKHLVGARTWAFWWD